MLLAHCGGGILLACGIVEAPLILLYESVQGDSETPRRHRDTPCDEFFGRMMMGVSTVYPHFQEDEEEGGRDAAACKCSAD